MSELQLAHIAVHELIAVKSSPQSAKSKFLSTKVRFYQSPVCLKIGFYQIPFSQNQSSRAMYCIQLIFAGFNLNKSAAWAAGSDRSQFTAMYCNVPHVLRYTALIFASFNLKKSTAWAAWSDRRKVWHWRRCSSPICANVVCSKLKWHRWDLAETW
jgi:hypothetical protein